MRIACTLALSRTLHKLSFRHKELEEVPCSHGTAEAEGLCLPTDLHVEHVNIRDKIISYCGQAVEDLLPSPQRAGSQAVPCGSFSCLTQHCCIN